MSDRNRELNLAEALRALPLQAPERSAWPELAAQLKPGSRFVIRDSAKPELWRRLVIPMALAATLVGVFVIIHRQQTTDPESQVPNTGIATVAPRAASSSTNSAQVSNVHNAATDGTQLTVLQQRSQDLERWLHATAEVAMPLQGQDLVAATEIENLIGLVDVELAAPQEMRDAGLWQRRVALLEDLSALRYSNYELAAGGGRVLAASLTN